MLPERYSSRLRGTQTRIPPRQPGEIRILSADIALMSSKKNKNDATAIFINQLLPTRAGRYISNIVYCDSAEGLHTEAQALMIRKLYDEFECDYIVLDTNGKLMPLYIVIYTMQRGRNRESCNANPSGRYCVKAVPHATHRC